MSLRLPIIISRDTARLMLSVCPRYLSCRVPTQRLGEVVLFLVSRSQVKAGNDIREVLPPVVQDVRLLIIK